MDRCAGRRQHLRGDRAARAAQLHGQHRHRDQPSALQHQPARSVLQQLGGAGRPAPDAAARARRHGRQLPFPPGGLAAALRLPARPRAHHVRDAQNPAAPREGDPDWDGPHWRIQLSLCEPHHLPPLCDFGCGLTGPTMAGAGGRRPAAWWWQDEQHLVGVRRGRQAVLGLACLPRQLAPRHPEHTRRQRVLSLHRLLLRKAGRVPGLHGADFAGALP